MVVIRDESLSGVLMIPLLHGKICSVRSCDNKATTIVAGLIYNNELVPDFCLCEKHYLKCKESGQIQETIDF